MNKPPFGFLAADVADLEFEHPARMISLPGGLSLDFSIVNYANWTKQASSLHVLYAEGKSLSLYLARMSSLRALKVPLRKRYVRGSPSYYDMLIFVRSVSVLSTIVSMLRQLWTRHGGCGNSKYARSGA